MLSAIAGKLGGRVKKCENYDPNVCKFHADASNRWHPVAVRGFPFSEELRISLEKRRVAVASNPEYVRVTVKGSLPLDGRCSINKPSELDWMEKSTLRIEDDPRWPVFIPSRTNPSDKLREFLCTPDVHTAMQDLLEGEVESVHIFEDEIILYSKTKSPDRILSYIRILVGLVRVQDERSLDLSGLPEGFEDLAPLIRKWAKPDDDERSDLIDDSPISDLRKLVHAVAPKFDQINQYLDAFAENPMPGVATALGRLAEAANEAQLRLSRED